MNRQRLAHWGVPVLAAAAVLLWMAAPALAQRGGGGHGGGGHGGGGMHAGGMHAGGMHMGGFSGGMHPGSSGSWGRGVVVVRPFPGGVNGFRRAYFFGFPGFYGGYGGFYGGYGGGYGGYGGGSYDNSYYFGSGDSVAYNPAPQTDDQTYPPEQPPATDPNTAALTVRVPEDAELWFDNTKMTQTGTVRDFVTPPLVPDKEYSYMTRARWTAANGKVFDQTHRVGFRAGQAILVDFLTPPPATSKAPAMEKVP
jgi:uncharacterized protein (TIGR03000 family)